MDLLTLILAGGTVVALLLVIYFAFIRPAKTHTIDRDPDA